MNETVPDAFRFVNSLVEPEHIREESAAVGILAAVVDMSVAVGLPVAVDMPVAVDLPREFVGYPIALYPIVHLFQGVVL